MVKKTFRDGSYYRHVLFGKRTVKEGECAAIWLADGRRKVVEGPKRVRLFFSHVRFLNRYVAASDQYLVVQYRDGRKEHRRGPIALFHDPCSHIEMRVEQAFKLAANEALVVYREEEKRPTSDGETAGDTSTSSTIQPPMISSEKIGAPGNVHRRVVRGPAVFIPAAYEWVHSFSWHGSTSNGKGSKTGTPGDEKVPHALNFEVLRTQPDQMYVSVRSVRTSDDAQVTIHLMLFYELKDIETMLNMSNDPIGDFIAATSADVMTFGAANTYEALVQRTALLSDVDTFTILKSRAAACGFELLKMVYRGHETSKALQSVHEESVAKRTKCKLSTDTRQMEQAQHSYELQCKQDRSRAEMALAEAELRHKLELMELEAAHQRKAADDDHTQKLRHEAAREEATLASLRARNDEGLRRDAALKEMGVDMTQYLCALNEMKPDHTTHIKLDKAAMAPTLHLDLPNSSAHRRA
mmetsp:Transcript_30183/g.78230  ORF Transcript_30183/g.78230 Transcript_30183/m.78230 type:complete len:468 (+) Transcript_30183:74-1477(+)